jgi:hypothetical protein
MLAAPQKKGKVRALMGLERRRWFGQVVALCALSASSTAHAGTYLDRAAILLHTANTEAEYLRARLGDRELARVVHGLAEARVSSATSMQVPREVVQAHPHLLLVLEGFERAARSAVDGNARAFVVHRARARDEEQTFRGVLKQLGYTLPTVKG